MQPVLSRISVTGADDVALVEDMLALSADFPKLEWALLYSPRHVGQAGYPSFEVLEAFAQRLPQVHTALHLCESAITDYLAEEPRTTALAAQFSRVQLNFFAKRMEIAPEAVDAAAARVSGSIIVPYNPANLSVVTALKSPKIQVLFDRSGGKGVQPDVWPDALPQRVCGYAGGLGPDDLGQTLPQIFAAAQRGQAETFWIDMESRLKDESGRFSLQRVRRVAEIVRQFEGA